MLQGGTAPIVPVMGGGNIRNVLNEVRKRRSKKGRGHNKKRTKKRKIMNAQSGGLNHYEIMTETDISSKFSVIVKGVFKLFQEENQDSLLVKSLKDKGAFNDQLFKDNFVKYSQRYKDLWTKRNKDVNMPTLGYYNSRLAVLLPKTITHVYVLPQIKGRLDVFYKVVRTIEKIETDNTLFIFAPPFFGDAERNAADNIKLYKSYITFSIMYDKYKTYILTEYSQNNRSVAGKLGEEMRAMLPEDDSLLYSLMGPTYILYKYSIDDASQDEPTDDIQSTVSERMKNIIIDFRSADLERKNTDTKLAEAVKRLDILTGPRTGMEPAPTVEQISEAVLEKKALEKDQKKRTKTAIEKRLLYNISMLIFKRLYNEEYEATSYDLTKVPVIIKKIYSDIQDYDALDTTKKFDITEEKIGDLYNELQDEEDETPDIRRKEEAFKALFIKILPELNDPTLTSINNVSQEKKLDAKSGGVIFSSETEEPTKILLKPKNIEQGLLSYTSGSYYKNSQKFTEFDSFAYDTVEDIYEDIDEGDTNIYNPYDTIDERGYYQFTFTPASVPLPPKLPDNMFVESNDIFKGTNDVQIAIGAKEFTIRGAVPEVTRDWENGQFSNDEADYLNYMNLNPKMLEKIFGSNWKDDVAEHLRTISTSKCFKDTKLILSHDCKDAQKFISKVLDYYTKNKEEIYKIRVGRNDTIIRRLKDELNAKISEAKGTTSTVRADAKNIFDLKIFVKTFFNNEDQEGREAITPGTLEQCITSVSTIFVDLFVRNVSLGKPITTKDIPTLERAIKILDAGARIEDNITFVFTRGVSLYNLIRVVRKVISDATFIVPPIQDDDNLASNTRSVAYLNTDKKGLSTTDMNLIQEFLGTVDNKIRNWGTTNISHVYHRPTWTFEKEIHPRVLFGVLNRINNNNPYNIVIETVDSDNFGKISEPPSIELVGNRLAKVFMFSEKYGELGTYKLGKISMDLQSGFDEQGKTLPELSDIIIDEYRRIATKVNEGNYKQIFGMV